MFIAALFTVARIWKQPRCPSVDEWIKTLWYIYTMEYCAAEKGRNSFATAWMELETITLKCSKPVGERQISYDLTYKKNLMNKIN